MEKIAFLFPGLGSQFIGMGKSFYEQNQLAKQTFEEASDVLGLDMAQLCFRGSLSQLNKAENLQPALITVCTAIYRTYMDEVNVRPFFSAGHSLGEYAALTCSGAIKFSDALRITRQRGILTKKIVDRDEGIMSIIDRISRDKAQMLCADYAKMSKGAYISCYNSENQVAVSGYHQAVEEIEEKVLEMDGQITPMLMSAPMHSPLMAEISGALQQELENNSYYLLKWPVIANVTGRPYPGPDAIPEMLSKQLTVPVQWEKTMKFLQYFGVTACIEMGPKNTLRKLLEENAPEIKGYCYGEKADREQLIGTFASDEQYQKFAPTVITKCLAVAVATPNANDNTEEYETGVVQNYKKIQQLQEQVETEGRAPSTAEMCQSLDLLHGILTAKKVDLQEREEWFHNILEDTNMEYELKDYAAGVQTQAHSA